MKLQNNIAKHNINCNIENNNIILQDNITRHETTL